MTERLQHLDEIEQCIWSELESCVASRPRPRESRVETGERADEPSPAKAAPHEWRMAVLSADGEESAAGTVVLREVDAPEHRLVFYTDARAPQVKQIGSSPQGTLVFHSRELGWQLRMRVRLAVETTGLAVSSRWARLQTPAGADAYRAVAAPGSPLDAPLDELSVRDHFAMIEAMAEAVEWVELDPAEPRRARFDGGGQRWL
jgi:hypothetical protein